MYKWTEIYNQDVNSLGNAKNSTILYGRQLISYIIIILHQKKEMFQIVYSKYCVNNFKCANLFLL